MSEIEKKTTSPLRRASRYIKTAVQTTVFVQFIWNGALKLWEALEWFISEGPGSWFL